MIADITQIDTDLFLFLNNLGSPTWDKLWFIYTEKRSHIPILLLLLILTYKTLGLKPFLVSVIVIALMATFTDQITNIVKYHFLRPRPCKLDILQGSMRYVAKRCSSYSFFSGHSSNSMAIAVIFSLLLKPKYPKAIYLILLWSLLMGYSRIYVGVHYPSDVLTGFAFGAISGTLFYLLYQKVISKLNL